MNIKTKILKFGIKFTFEDGSSCYKYYSGEEYWYNKLGKFHRGNDQPAYIGADGTMEWWVNGKRHRDNDQPAIIYADGTKEWWFNDKRHRDNGLPAIILANGTKEW